MKTVALRDIRSKGLQALKTNLGSSGAFRFIQEINTGSGDYTRERKEWLKDESIDDIYLDIKARRNKQ